MLTDAYLHGAAVCLIVAAFLLAIPAGFAVTGVCLGALAYLRARAERPVRRRAQ